MHRIARMLLTGLLAASLLNVPPAAAAAGKPLGVVVKVENARLAGENAALGTNVFAGDYVETDPGGTLRLKLGANQLYLGSASSAIVLEEQNKVRLKLTHGMLGFLSPGENQLEIETPVGLVRAAKGTGAFGEVTLLGPQQILVAAYHGAIVVSGAGVERTIKEGDAFNVSLLPNADPSAPDQGPQGAGTGNNNGNNNGNSNTQKGIQNYGQVIFTAAVLGMAAGGAYAAWDLTTESNPNPPPQ